MIRFQGAFPARATLGSEKPTNHTGKIRQRRRHRVLRAWRPRHRLRQHERTGDAGQRWRVERPAAQVRDRPCRTRRTVLCAESTDCIAPHRSTARPLRAARVASRACGGAGHPRSHGGVPGHCQGGRPGWHHLARFSVARRGSALGSGAGSGAGCEPGVVARAPSTAAASVQCGRAQGPRFRPP